MSKYFELHWLIIIKAVTTPPQKTFLWYIRMLDLTIQEARMNTFLSFFVLPLDQSYNQIIAYAKSLAGISTSLWTDKLLYCFVKPLITCDEMGHIYSFFLGIGSKELKKLRGIIWSINPLLKGNSLILRLSLYLESDSGILNDDHVQMLHAREALL